MITAVLIRTSTVLREEWLWHKINYELKIKKLIDELSKTIVPLKKVKMFILILFSCKYCNIVNYEKIVKEKRLTEFKTELKTIFKTGLKIVLKTEFKT